LYWTDWLAAGAQMTDVVESSTSPVDPRVRIDEPAPVDASRQIEELTTALAARDSFIALVGHELRNSVAPMVLLAEQFTTLAEDPRAPPLMASRVAVLTRNLHKFVATVDRVAEIADLRRGKLRLELDQIDLVDVATTVCRDAEREAAAAGAELVIQAHEQVVGTWDRSRLKQIVGNLVSNAIRYAGGRIELHIRIRDSDGELVVRDQGPGIDPAVLPSIFEPFDRARSGRTSGFGVGLWLAKTLCNAMHGDVTAENSASGGVSFCVVLPRG
jgi:signal transduction histidine kinase